MTKKVAVTYNHAVVDIVTWDVSQDFPGEKDIQFQYIDITNNTDGVLVGWLYKYGCLIPPPG